MSNNRLVPPLSARRGRVSEIYEILDQPLLIYQTLDDID